MYIFNVTYVLNFRYQ